MSLVLTGVLVKFKVGLRPTEHQPMEEDPQGEAEEEDTDSLLTSAKQSGSKGVKGMLASFTGPHWAHSIATPGPKQGGDGGGVVRGAE